MNVDVCGWLLGASRARGPLDRGASLARGVPTHRYARRDKSYSAVCRGVPGAGVGADIVQQQLNVPGAYRRAAL